MKPSDFKILQRLLVILVIIGSFCMVMQLLTPLLIFGPWLFINLQLASFITTVAVVIIPFTPVTFGSGAIAAFCLAYIRPKDELTKPLVAWGILLTLFFIYAIKRLEVLYG